MFVSRMNTNPLIAPASAEAAMPIGTANELTLPLTSDILAAKSWTAALDIASKAASQLTLAPMALNDPFCSTTRTGWGTMSMTGSLAEPTTGTRSSAAESMMWESFIFLFVRAR